MTLPADDLVVLRQWVGTEPDDASLEALYVVYENYDEVVLNVLNTRLAELTLELGSVTVPGVSISHSTDLEALKLLLKNFRNGGGTGLEDSFEGGFRTQSIQINYPR